MCDKDMTMGDVSSAMTVRILLRKSVLTFGISFEELQVSIKFTGRNLAVGALIYLAP